LSNRTLFCISFNFGSLHVQLVTWINYVQIKNLGENVVVSDLGRAEICDCWSCSSTWGFLGIWDSDFNFV